MKSITTQDMMISRIVNEQYQLRVQLIDMFIKKNHLSYSSASACLNIDPSTIHRHKQGKTRMGIIMCIEIFVHIKVYMEEHHVEFDDEMKDIIRRIDLFSISLKEKEE